MHGTPPAQDGDTLPDWGKSVQHSFHIKRLEEIADLDGLQLQEKIVEKLERKLNPKSRDRDISERIRKIVRVAPLEPYPPVLLTPKLPESSDE